MQPTWVSDCERVKLYHADCREVPTHGDAVITDPPYQFAHVDGGGFAAASKFYRGGKLDGIDQFDISQYADVLTACPQLVAFHSRDLIRDYADLCLKTLGKYDLHVWHKVNAIPFSCNTWKSDIEYIALGWSEKWHQPAKQHMKSKVYSSSICQDRHHPACKPIPLIEKYVSVLVPPDHAVIDPFMGSGTTGVACIRLGRRFVGIEIDEHWYNVAKARIEAELLRYDGGPLFREQPNPDFFFVILDPITGLPCSAHASVPIPDGWTAAAWRARLRQLAAFCERMNPGLAEWYRELADAVQ